MEEIAPELFRIEVPLPNSSLKYLNSYVIRGEDKNLIVDTGMNLQECLDVMLADLQKLDIDMEKTDFFITHLHGDHSGLVRKLATDQSKIYFNQPERELLKNPKGFDLTVSYIIKNGFPEERMQVALGQFEGRRRTWAWAHNVDIVKDGDVISVGDYTFTCVNTPGHSFGHTCLYEPEKKILIAGDHLLIDITPGIQCYADNVNPLKTYLSSLDKVNKLDIDLVLPGHRRLFKNHSQRITEIKEHHRLRLDEVIDILKKGTMDAFHVASEMTWDVHSDTWDEVPENQKWFAVGEAIAHLRYLEEDGMVLSSTQGETTRYSLA